jgi:hypothetical protein
MTIASLPSPSRPTHARARLWLGIAGVGGVVLLAAGALLSDLPARTLARDPAQPLLAAVAQVLAALMPPTLLLAPLDALGGLVVVRERPAPTAWRARWLRGVAAQLAVWAAAAAVLLAAARAGGAGAALAASALLQCALLVGRPWLARAVAPLSVSRTLPPAIATAARTAGLDAARLRVVDAGDPGFTGGFTGVTARTLWVPAHWVALPAPVLAAQLARRRAVAGRGLHARGVAGALAWNLAGLAGVLLLAPGADAATAAGLVTAVAWTTLWSFLGALLLPTPSRAAVLAADADAACSVGGPAVRDAITALDRWQDDEPDRPRAVEAVFHPVPSPATRLRRLASPQVGASGAHQLARHALYLAWGMLSPLSRAVHCNVGRPALWVFWPGD